MILTLLSVLLPLLDDRPPVTDLARFPSESITREQLWANRLYHTHIEGRQGLELHRCWDLMVVLAETKQLYDDWDTLHWAHRYRNDAERRDMLKLLRDRIGPDNYYAGRMPPCVPLWRLTPRNP